MDRLVVLFDAEILENALRDNGSRSGIFFVSYNVVKQIKEDDRVDLYLYCRSQVRQTIIDYFQQEFQVNIASNILMEGDDLSCVSIFLSTIFAIPEYVRKFPDITCFTVIHDVIPLLFPYYFSAALHSWFAQLIKSINGNDFYFAVSEYTKQDFVRYVPAIDSEKITVIRLAADERFYSDTDATKLQQIKNKYHIPNDKKYLFSLCTLEPRKNLICAVASFIAFIKKHEIEDMVYVLGGGMWNEFVGRMEEEIPDFHQYADRIIRTGYLPDEDLAPLISNAEWFVYTSQYEGFGMPPLEAMQCGCPVIVSNNSSLPEVVGDAGISIDYDSIEQHVEAYETYYYNPELRKVNARRGLEHAKDFTWKKCVDTMVEQMIEVEKRKYEQPLVTVVTATWNILKNHREAQFRQCIESVHAQTYSRIEHLVIDNASDDGTLEILKEYADKGWITFRSEKDNGIYDAMNKGIAESKGTFVNFLNSDDYFHDERAIERSMAQLMKSQADYSYADTRVLSVDEKEVSWKGDISKLLISMHYCHQTMFVRTDVLKSLGGFDTSYHVAADSDLMIRLYAQGYKHTYLPACFLTYREGGFSGQHAKLLRVEHSTSFYRHIGRQIGLTPFDCFALWQERCFAEMPVDKLSGLIAKVPVEFGAEYLTNRLIQKIDVKQSAMLYDSCSQFYLFGCIPVMKRKTRNRKMTYDLFNFLRVLKITNYRDKRKYFLFGFLPVWKVKTRLL